MPPGSTGRRPRIPLLVLVLVLVLSAAGCGDTEGPPTQPPVSELALQELARTLGEIQVDYLDANAPVWRSLEVLSPYIRSTLQEARGSASRIPGLTTPCLAPSLTDRTFGFDGSEYVSGDLTGAPVFGVRFLLYEVNDQRAPDVDRPLGHLEIRCLSGENGLDLQVRVVSRGFEVFGVSSFGSYPDPVDLGFSGSVRTPDGQRAWAWGGGLLGEGFFYTAEFPGGIRGLYTVLDQEGTTPDNVLAQIRKANPDLEWEVYADILAGAAGDILEGPVRLTTPEGSRLAACMTATIEMPAVASPQGGACSSLPLPALSPSPEDLRVLEAAYAVLRDLYLSAGELVAIGLAGVAVEP